MTLGQRFEEERKGMFGQKDTTNDNRANHMFSALRTHGANPKRLAQLLTVWEYTMKILEWDDNLTSIVADYQASIDTRYHDDYKAVATIEELDRRLAMRRASAYNNQGLINNQQ